MNKCYSDIEREADDVIRERSEQSWGFISKMKSLFFKPKEFFEAIQEENSYWPSIKLYLFVVAILLTVEVVINFFGIATMEIPTGQIESQPVAEFVVFYIVYLIIAIPFLLIGSLIMLFFIAALQHLTSRLFKAEEPYLATFKAVIYPQIFLYLSNILLAPLTVIPIVGGIIGSFAMLCISIWAFVQEVIGIAAGQKLTYGKAILVIIIPGLILGGLMCAGAFVLLSIIGIGLS